MQGVIMPKLFDVNSVKPVFNIQNKSNGVAEMFLYGAVGDDAWDGSAVSAVKFSDELKKLPKDTKEIQLRINSPGGSVFDGLTIYERLKQHSAKVVVFIDGVAASIASIIAMAGDEIHIGEGSFLMIHKPHTFAWGNDLELERTIEVLQKIEDQMIGIYSRKTGLSRAQLSNMLMQDTWIKSEEAKDMGFVTNVIESSSQLQVAASMLKNAKWIKNPPEIVNAQAKAKVLEFKNRLNTFLAR
jgi:ATP-dependent Clp protease protease subunit